MGDRWVDMVRVILYSKPGCTPCAAVRGYLALRQRVYPHELIEIDLSRDAALAAQIGSAIPVVEIGAHRLVAPILNGDLDKALRAATQEAADA